MLQTAYPAHHAFNAHAEARMRHAAGTTESQSCAEGYTGNQTRTCSSSCQWGAWDDSLCKKKACSGSSSRSCGCNSLFSTSKKGTQTRTCIDGEWSDWSACVGYTTHDRQQCPGGGNEEYQCVPDASGDHWGWEQIKACPGDDAGGGSSCTWQTVATYMCGTNVPQSACRGYSQCSINDYCPGGGIRVEACL